MANHLHLNRARLPQGWADNVRLTVEGGVITAIETGVPQGDAERIAGAVVPAVTNLHSHAFQRAMAGLAERAKAGVEDFWAWREAMYRFLDRITPEQMEAIAAMLYAELAEGGYSGIVEFHYLHNDPTGQAYADPAETAHAHRRAAEAAGFGLTLAPVLYSHSSFGGLPPKPGQRRFIKTTDQFLRLLELSKAEAFAFHSLRAVTPEQIRDVLAAVDPVLPIHIHAAEQTGEVDDCLAWSGARPVEWLLANAPMSSRWTLVHATHMTDAEASGLARAGSTVALCPSTEGNLGDGFFNADAFLGAGGRFGIGSDSHVTTNVAEELRWFEYGRRLQLRKRTLSGGTGEHVGAGLWLSAARAGANPTGLKTGEIAVGARCDLVVLDESHPTLVERPGDLILDSLVFSGSGGIDQVWSGGRRIVEGGRHIAREAIAARYRQAVRELSE
ncbi:formimidoylglutamate deiminase [Caulobacter mirabilis]|uniref:Formimidoylglutamate deiminase n=1 Tax=Caulobacter mirabilis TaxID=69666 RepID=A0A2D2B2Q1_9CAUL|nr:formimidoylglutamate deiminase [Caulobacter mirabilis]ATQ44545.1 formimidoylglutamate deiminase [Caulobacter mirabilis]